MCILQNDQLLRNTHQKFSFNLRHLRELYEGSFYWNSAVSNPHFTGNNSCCTSSTAYIRINDANDDCQDDLWKFLPSFTCIYISMWSDKQVPTRILISGITCQSNPVNLRSSAVWLTENVGNWCKYGTVRYFLRFDRTKQMIHAGRYLHLQCFFVFNTRYNFSCVTVPIEYIRS